MKSNSTTTLYRNALRRYTGPFDLYAVIGGIAGLLLLWVLVPRLHWIQELNSRISDEQAITVSRQWLDASGYSEADFTAEVAHRIHTTERNFVSRNRASAQSASDAAVIEGDAAVIEGDADAQIRPIIPQQYLEITRGSDTRDALSQLAMSFGTGSVVQVETDEATHDTTPTTAAPSESTSFRMVVRLNYDGHIFAFQTQGQWALEPTPHLPALHAAFPQLMDPADSSSTLDESRIVLHLPDFDRNRRLIQPYESSDGFFVLDAAAIEAMARHHLTQTIWTDHPLTRDSITTETDTPVMKLRTRFVSETLPDGRTLRVEVHTDRLGNLYGIRPAYLLNGESTPSVFRYQNMVPGIGYMILVIITLILLVRRFGQGLVDTKTARRDAWVGGLIALIFFSSSFFGEFRELSTLDWSAWVGLSAGALFLTFGGWFVVFTISAMGSSVSQEVWPHRLKQISLIRMGYLLNVPIGLALTRGVLVALALAGATITATHLLPNNGPISDTTQQFLDTSLSPWFIGLVAETLFGKLIILFCVFLGVGALVRKRLHHPSATIASITLFMSLLGILPFEFAPLSSYLVLTIVISLLFALVFWQWGAVAATIALVLYAIIWILATGFSISENPDLPQLLLLLSIPVTTLLVGLTGIRTGRTSEELPDYIPAYLIEMANRERVHRELEIARQVQQSFLPGSTPLLDGLELAAGCQPASEVGGDYYEFLPMAGRQLALAIGDVSGKGIQAAFYMTLIKGFTQSLSESGVTPNAFLCRINQLFYRNAKRGTFISMIYGIVDADTGRLRLSRAGHNPAMVYRKHTGAVTLLKEGGMALGLVNDSRFEQFLQEVELNLSVGDMVFLYTDGYTEAMNPAKELFGEERLAGVIMAHANEPLRGILDHINRAVSDFTKGAHQSDDMTIMALRFGNPA